MRSDLIPFANSALSAAAIMSTNGLFVRKAALRHKTMHWGSISGANSPQWGHGFPPISIPSSLIATAVATTS
jgi:hypothetical protein